MRLRQAKKIVRNLSKRESAYTDAQIRSALRCWNPKDFYNVSAKSYHEVNDWIKTLAKSGRYPHLTEIFASK